MRLLLQIAVLALYGSAVDAHTTWPQRAEAKNWCSEAERSLTDKAGVAVKCSVVKSRCAKMNNYWCQKHGPTPWNGSRTASGKNGNRDAANHVVFEDASWSARAMAIDLRSKYNIRKYRTANAIAAAHSPWCDTLGSRAVVDGSKRTCTDGGEKAGSGTFTRVCAVPTSEAPSTSDCNQGCNCPPSIAADLVNGLGIGINDDLNLFNEAGDPQPNLARFMKNLALRETGLHVRDEVIDAGIAKLKK